MFENKLTKIGGIHYTRYINSWQNVGGKMDDIEFFDEWLRSEGLTSEEIRDIHDLCYCAGKLELEISAKPYIEKQKKAREELIKELKKEDNVAKKKIIKKLISKGRRCAEYFKGLV